MADKTLVDPLGRECTLKDTTWDRHILVSHPDMDGWRGFVQEAVRSPISIWESGRNADVRVYFGPGPLSALLVAVKVDISARTVLTAHLVKRETGSRKEWPSP